MILTVKFYVNTCTFSTITDIQNLGMNMTFISLSEAKKVNFVSGKTSNEILLTSCSFHRIEQNICLVGTSINKGCAVYYYSAENQVFVNEVS